MPNLAPQRIRGCCPALKREKQAFRGGTHTALYKAILYGAVGTIGDSAFSALGTGVYDDAVGMIDSAVRTSQKVPAKTLAP